jgi:outer membrane receptor protein involved in Fe transport
MEAALAWSVGERTAVRAYATYTDIDVHPDGKLRQRPDWRGGIGFNQGIAQSLSLDADLLLVGDSFDSSIPTGGEELDGYARLDVALTWRPVDELRCVLSVDNILDENYEEAIGFPAPGRRLRFTIGMEI